MDGTHLLGEWHGCHGDNAAMHDAAALRMACLECVAAAGLTVVGDCFHQFQPRGCTGAVILAESHLAIHTWPELGSVTLDIYVCNRSADHTSKAEQVFRQLQQLFQPQHAHYQAISRRHAV